MSDHDIRTYAARLKSAREEAGLSQSELARRVGMRPQSIQALEDGKAQSSKKTVQIARVLGVNPDWLATGAGPRRLSGSARPASVAIETPGVVMVAELDVRAAAGPNGSLIDVDDGNESDHVIGLYGFPVEGFREVFGTAPERVRIIQVIGDSMQPTLFPGQRVMVDTADRRPSPPGVFVVWDGLGLVIKRLEFLPHSDPPTVRIISDNARYAPYDRGTDEAHICGRVIGAWGRM